MKYWLTQAFRYIALWNIYNIVRYLTLIYHGRKIAKLFKRESIFKVSDVTELNWTVQGANSNALQ